ncbi:MAG: rRNA maturation RNase YbeY, partial [Candidatus Uhrbacteria bacterium]
VISVALVSSKRMRVLNRIYRGEDRATDVLAFGRLQAGSGRPAALPPPRTPPPGGRGGNIKRKKEFLPLPPGRERGSEDQDNFLPLPPGGGARGGGELGEIIICPAIVRQNARRAGEPFRRELLRVLVHGTLHLCGYDHATARGAKQMFKVQETIVGQLFRHSERP